MFVLLPEVEAGHEQYDLPAVGREGAPAAAAPATDRPRSAEREDAAAPAIPGAAIAAGAARADTGGGGRAPAGAVGRLGPRYGDGRLWVTPYPQSPSELAERIRRSHGELVDSAVTAVVQAYLDSIALEPGAQFAELPSWVAEVGGKKFGLDSKFIYVAGLKIPSAVLALLPFPQGNVDQALANRRLQDLRADLFQAAQRAENAAEFKKAIREIRERKVREEEFERNRRTPPGDEAAP